MNKTTMTLYETIALVIAGVALIQPWVFWVYKRFCKPLILNFIPSSKIKLYFNRSGAYIYLGGVFEAKNQSAMVKKISATIQRQNDNTSLNLDWSSFISPINQYVGNNSITTNEIARPFRVPANDLVPIFMDFINTDSETYNTFVETHTALMLKAKSICTFEKKFDEVLREYKSMPEYAVSRETILERLYWKKGDYTLTLKITHSDDCIKQYKYIFDIDADSAENYKENIEKSMNAVIHDYYGLPLNFHVDMKDFVESKGLVKTHE